MVSKNQIKLITSLQQKKYRKEHGLFIAEGRKVIQELLDASFDLHQLFVTESLFEGIPSSKRFEITPLELTKISALKTANNCLALFKIPSDQKIDASGLLLGLDDVRDPGNMGTIMRLCDWYGITDLVCSEDTVDLYNPKVVQATMGSIARVRVHYLNLESFVQDYEGPVFGTFMDGVSIYKEKLPNAGIIIMGNEANGISDKIAELTTQRIAIPRFGSLQQTESLNVASATAIILSEFMRSQSS